MDKINYINPDYQNKSMRLPMGIVDKYLQYPIFQHFMLVSAGHRDSVNNTGHFIERYSECEYILIYCTAGQGWLQAAGKKYLINHGDVLFCFKNSVHCYGASEDNPWEIFWSCFSGEDVPYRLELLGTGVEVPVIHIGIIPKIILLFSEILEILRKGYALQHLVYASDCLKQVLSNLCLLIINDRQQDSSEPIIENTLALMNRNIDGIIKLEDLSSEAGMSANYFTKFFQRKIGYTPVDYFIRLKMQKACTLLNNTSLNVKEISYQLGYQDVYYFSRVFKKKVGYSPREYRRQLKD